MPPIDNERQRTGRLPGASLLPDRDNPFAWKQMVAQGKRGALELLGTLSDDEVRTYMAVAKDQIGLEERYWALKMASGVLGLGVIGAGVLKVARHGFSATALAGLGLGLVFCYWPWRVVKSRELWKRHYDAARAEDERRRRLAGA